MVKQTIACERKMAFLLCEAMKKVAATIDQLIVKLYRYSSSFVVGTLACMHSCIPRPNRILNHLPNWNITSSHLKVHLYLRNSEIYLQLGPNVFIHDADIGVEMNFNDWLAQYLNSVTFRAVFSFLNGLPTLGSFFVLFGEWCHFKTAINLKYYPSIIKCWD